MVCHRDPQAGGPARAATDHLHGRRRPVLATTTRIPNSFTVRDTYPEHRKNAGLDALGVDEVAYSSPPLTDVVVRLRDARPPSSIRVFDLAHFPS